ncbi:MAG TPA: DUF2306 domain-containing protein [Candidatus Bathyarchaeia archaeon]|nr:DUF2306 domain-containing protein [Candidatus Bathyarchaeia archaeon]
MSTPSPLPERALWLRPKYLLFGFIGLMMAYVLVHNERFLINRSDPEWTHLSSFKWYLLPHGIMGACALLLGPMQFSDRLRQRFAKFHRVVGRFYVAGVFIGAPLGIYIQHYEERMGGTRSFSLAAFTDAAIWMLTTAIAMYFILKGKVQLHRQWMTRSFAVAIVFLEVRVVYGVFGFDDSSTAGETIVWMCVAFSLLFADFVLQWQDLRRSRPAAVSVQPVPAVQTASD